MSCTLCSDELGQTNVAVFPCGHAFHLSCVFAHSFKTTCSLCDATALKLPDLGSDREIAMSAEKSAAVFDLLVIDPMVRACLSVCSWEGGNRLVGVIRGPGIKQREPEFGLMHGADWMPSLLRFALHRHRCILHTHAASAKLVFLQINMHSSRYDSL